MKDEIRLIPLKLPIIKTGDEITDKIIEAAEKQGYKICDGDIIVLTSKIVSKSKGYIIDPNKIITRRKARILSKITKIPGTVIQTCIDKYGDPLFLLPYSKALEQPLTLIKITKNIEEAKNVMRKYPNMLVYKTPWGLATDCGIDFSNMPKDKMSYPPPNPNYEAREIRMKIKSKTGKNIGVIITDTEIAMLRPGTLEIAIGTSGIKTLANDFADKDLYNKPKIGGIDLIADQLANAAGLLMGQTNAGIPVVIIRGASQYLLETEEELPQIENIGGIFYRSIIKTIIMKILLFIMKILKIK